MRLRLLAALLALVAAAAPASAQIAGPPNVFVTGAVIDAGQMNANFAAIYNAALNRTGGTMSGPLVFSPDNTYDVGGSGTARPRDLNLARNAVIAGTLAVTGASTLTGALGVNNVLTVTSTTSPQFLARYDSSNRVDLSVSSAGAVTFNAVGAGAGFNFSDPMAIAGALSTTSTITAAGTISSTGGSLLSTSTGPALKLLETDASADEKLWRLVASAATGSMQACNDIESICGTAWSIARTGSTVTSFDVVTQLRAAAGTVSLPSYAFTADPDTGIYSGGANVINFGTGGTVRAALSSIGFAIVSGGLSVGTGGMVAPGETLFAALGTPGDGTLVYCPDCTFANPCAGAGTGAIAKRLNGAWRCD